MPWLEAFPGVNMLMRRPFHIAEAYGMGLYNDMTGHKESTEEWLTWIQEGGDYGQAEEKRCAWQYARLLEDSSIGR